MLLLHKSYIINLPLISRTISRIWSQSKISCTVNTKIRHDKNKKWSIIYTLLNTWVTSIATKYFSKVIPLLIWIIHGYRRIMERYWGVSSTGMWQENNSLDSVSRFRVVTVHGGRWRGTGENILARKRLWKTMWIFIIQFVTW